MISILNVNVQSKFVYIYQLFLSAEDSSINERYIFLECTSKMAIFGIVEHFPQCIVEVVTFRSQGLTGDLLS